MVTGPRAAKRDHTIHRLWQRCGFAASLPEIYEIENRLRAGGEAVVVEDGDRAVIALTWRGRPIHFVFDRRLDCVITALPPGWSYCRQDRQERKRA